MLLLYIVIFLVSCVCFYLAAKLVVDGLIRTAKFLGLREFTVAFFSMAIASSLPNLVVGLSAAFRGIPEFSFGDVSGNNLAALTLVVAIAVLFTKGGIPAASRTILTSSFFVTVAVLLPLILILDGNLSRPDGLILIGLFIFYVIWLFSKKERFTKVYDGYNSGPVRGLNFFLKDLGKIILGLVVFVVASQGIVSSAQFFAENFNVSIILIGILITGAGSSLPEIYFDSVSAKKGETWMILGDIMGAIIIPSTLVLGIVVLIAPIHISDFSSLALARLFIVVSALLFPLLVKSGKKISKKEALFLLMLYIFFLVVQIFFQSIVHNSGFNFLFK